MMVMGVRGEGVERSAKLVSAAMEELDDIVDSVLCRSWLDRPESFSTEDWTGIVALDATEDVDVRRSCL